MTFDKLYAAFQSKCASDPQLRSLKKKINSGKADFSDTAAYSERISTLLGQTLSKYIDGIPEGDRERICKWLLREQYKDTNTICEVVQEALDEAQGIHLTPQKAPFPAERVQAVAHALEDLTVKPETIRRRANAPVANVAKSFHDDYIKTNARVRSDLGLKATITRFGAGCCAWCAAVSGKYRFGEQPEDIFRRHDNCNCTIIYDTQVLRGRQTSDGGRSKTWEEVDPAKIGQNPPAVLSQAEAQKLQENALNQLTKPGQGDIMAISGAISGALNPDSKEADKHAKQYYEAVRKMTTDVKRISENTGYPESLIQQIKDFVFNEKHDLGNRVDYFDPDYKMAQSWQRLIDGKDIKTHDLTLLKHEQMEHDLMQQGYSQSDAHAITSQKYNYGKEASEYYDQIKKNSKK